MMKSVEQEKPTIKEILQQGLEKGYITEGEYNKGLACQTWEEIQPILDKAQNIKENKDELKLARAANPLHASDFTE